MIAGFGMPAHAVSRGGRSRRLPVVGAAIGLAIVVGTITAWHPSSAVAARNTVTIYSPGASTATLDPAAQSDQGSAQVDSQLFESLTAVDSNEHVQPALAASWESQSGGKRVVFHLRSGLTFSNGSPLTAGDVVKSWMRVLAPAHPSQLAPLLDDVVGARAYREGTGTASSVGISAPSSTDVQVDLTRPAADFPAIASSPSLAVVPPDVDTNPSLLSPGTFVGSGAYVLSAVSQAEVTLTANSHYWAGPPAMQTVHVVSDTGSTAPLDAFKAGSLDYTPVSVVDATTKIVYDSTLGPSLRIAPSPSVEFFGFNTTRPPFNNVHVRRAFQMGIDWNRIVTLLSDPLVVPATGMVPVGVPGHSATDFGPKFDLATAKSELAAAGYPNGVGFPRVDLVTGGTTFDWMIVRQLHDNLGIDVAYTPIDWPTYFWLLPVNPPDFWEMDWVADYPGANDFLGLLLGSGQTNNFGRWSNADFDAAVTRALAATDPTASQQAFDQAQAIVQDQAPVIPVDYGAGYALAAKGLLGALPNSQGLMRYAGLAWAAGS